MLTKEPSWIAGTVNGLDPQTVPTYVIGYMLSGILPLNAFRELAALKGDAVAEAKSAASRTEEQTWADTAARARGTWARENPF